MSATELTDIVFAKVKNTFLRGQKMLKRSLLDLFLEGQSKKFQGGAAALQVSVAMSAWWPLFLWPS